MNNVFRFFVLTIFLVGQHSLAQQPICLPKYKSTEDYKGPVQKVTYRNPALSTISVSEFNRDGMKTLSKRVTDFYSQTIVYTYDEFNRVLTEKETWIDIETGKRSNLEEKHEYIDNKHLLKKYKEGKLSSEEETSFFFDDKGNVVCEHKKVRSYSDTLPDGNYKEWQNRKVFLYENSQLISKKEYKSWPDTSKYEYSEYDEYGQCTLSEQSNGFKTISIYDEKLCLKSITYDRDEIYMIIMYDEKNRIVEDQRYSRNCCNNEVHMSSNNTYIYFSDTYYEYKYYRETSSNVSYVGQCDCQLALKTHVKYTLKLDNWGNIIERKTDSSSDGISFEKIEYLYF